MRHAKYLPAILVWDLTPKRWADHHAQKDHSGQKGLFVLTDAPFTMQGGWQNAQNHDFHGICHPTEASDKAEDDLEFSESQCIDSLCNREWIIGNDSWSGSWDLDLRPWNSINPILRPKIKTSKLCTPRSIKYLRNSHTSHTFQYYCLLPLGLLVLNLNPIITVTLYIPCQRNLISQLHFHIFCSK